MRQINTIILTLLILFFFSSCNSPSKYPSGKDTVESYGDGTFQIIRSHMNIQGLFFEGKGSPLIPTIDRIYETNNYAYIIGQEKHQLEENTIIYGIINIKNNTIQIYFDSEMHIEERFLDSDSIELLTSFEGFSNSDQKIFQDLELGNIGRVLSK